MQARTHIYKDLDTVTNTHCRVAARLARQRMPRTAAAPRVPSELIAATMIQQAYIFDRISCGSENKKVIFNELTVTQKKMLRACCDTGACRQTSCLKTSRQTVRWRRHATAALAAVPRVARWRRHAFPGCMDGTPRPRRHPHASHGGCCFTPYPVGGDATGASPGTQRRVAAARLAWQRTTRTPAAPRVQSELFAVTMIQRAYIFYWISG